MKQKVSLVLSGGGARGIAHIGVIEELEKSSFEICHHDKSETFLYKSVLSNK
jgi:predicted patatin/cPLA2 family phospholipase